MTPGQKKILDRIRKGDFTTANWSEVAGSPKSLNVQIFRLRARGYVIDVTKHWVKGRRGSQAATYKFIRGPRK